MTGFESWVKAGLELGAKEMLDVLDELEAHDADLTPKLIAERLMQRWPPWKAARSRVKELALNNMVCSRCKSVRDRLYGSAHGPVCSTCLDSHIRGEWS